MDRASFGGVEGIVWNALQFSWKKKLNSSTVFLNERFVPLFFLIVLQWIKVKLGSKTPRDFKKINNQKWASTKQNERRGFGFLKKNWVGDITVETTERRAK